MNVFFVIDNQLITPPLGGSILPGVTRDSIILLAKRLGYSVQERNIDLDELSNAYKQGRLQEAFGTGTAATISPIGKFGLENSEIIINDQKAGPVARHLLTSLSDIYYGDTSDHWSVLVD
jgi:branched-chain amino acid aminotransferase